MQDTGCRVDKIEGRGKRKMSKNKVTKRKARRK